MKTRIQTKQARTREAMLNKKPTKLFMPRAPKKKRITLDANLIQRIVESQFNMMHGETTRKCRKHTIVFPRQISMTLTACYLTISLADNGRINGGKDHATVLHAIKTVANAYKTNKKDREDILQCQKRLQNKVHSASLAQLITFLTR